jgi:soluble lytic murein transglycosylase
MRSSRTRRGRMLDVNRVMVCLALLAGAAEAGQRSTPTVSTLIPTLHPAVPTRLSDFWLVPDAPATTPSAGVPDLLAGIKAFDAARYDEALALVTRPAIRASALTPWARYYEGFATLRLERPSEARSIFDGLAADRPEGYLSEALTLRRAECAEALGDWAAAARFYEQLIEGKPATPDDVLLRLAKAAESAGDRARAAQAFARVYYEFPFSDLSDVAGVTLEQMGMLQPLASGNARYKLELGRAERLFGARRYAQARSAFEALRPVASGDDRELVSLRLAECDHFLRRYRAARDTTAPFIEDASRRAEALFFHLTATRELGDHDTYVRLARELVAKYPDSSWAEDTLNNLATHYILVNDDPQADLVFKEILARYPGGRHGERAAWKSGWWSYKHDRYDEAIAIFEAAAMRFPRSDYRPSYLYWAARAHDAQGDRPTASERYALITADYLNSYYGRLSANRLRARGAAAAVPAGGRTLAPPAAGARDEGNESIESPPPTADAIRLLLSAGLIDQGLSELQYAQRVWGNSRIIQATFAWVYNQQGELRRGINAMKRAYPQYLASGGERLPNPVLKVIFPLDYWPLIQEHSSRSQLDPHVVAALIAQESTFDPDIVSSARAVGLMQVVAPTGRRLARSLKIRFAPSMLTRPEVNVRLGTTYFAELVRRFGGVHFALASYNAGEHRVARWIAERPGLDQDEFIDDIPFPETQNYVKRVLGTAEDYRRLYGQGARARMN